MKIEISSLDKENLWEWQSKTIKKYLSAESPRNGTINAVTGSGKTLTGLLIAQGIGGEVIITSHKNSILDQWKRESKKWSISANFKFFTLQKLCKIDNINCDLLIVDEAHRSVSKEFKKIYDIVNYKNILGLSGTPCDDVLYFCGDEVVVVDYDEAQISDFEVIFHGIDLTEKERITYDKLTKKIGALFKKIKDDDDDNKSEQILKFTIIQRRNLVYNANKRMLKGKEIIINELAKGGKILVFTQRKEQADDFAKYINVPHIIYHSGRKDNLNSFRNGDVKLCISVGMLTEGFDDVDTDTVIVLSTILSEAYHLQSIGRAIRWKKNKNAKIHIILAKDTTDENVLKHALSNSYDYTLNDNLEEVLMGIIYDENKNNYYRGKKFSINTKREIWKSNSSPREYYEYDKRLDIVFTFKPLGGKISLSNKGIYIYVDGEYICIAEDKIKLEKIINDSNLYTFGKD